MRRGEIWTISGGPDYAGKPRPAVIVQGDAYATTRSVTICTFTTHVDDAPFLRITIEPSSANGLQRPSRVMVDKVVTVPRIKLGRRVGALSDADMMRVGHALAAFLDLAP